MASHGYEPCTVSCGAWRKAGSYCSVRGDGNGCVQHIEPSKVHAAKERNVYNHAGGLAAAHALALYDRHKFGSYVTHQSSQAETWGDETDLFLRLDKKDSDAGSDALYKNTPRANWARAEGAPQAQARSTATLRTGRRRDPAPRRGRAAFRRERCPVCVLADCACPPPPRSPPHTHHVTHTHTGTPPPPTHPPSTHTKATSARLPASPFDRFWKRASWVRRVLTSAARLQALHGNAVTGARATDMNAISLESGGMPRRGGHAPSVHPPKRCSGHILNGAATPSS